MATLKFQSIIKIRGVNPYVDVSAEQAAKLKPNWRRPLPVLVQVNGQPAESWHINMMPVGNGNYYLYLHEVVRKASNTKVGDSVTIELDFDQDYKNGPMHPMPELFARGLEHNPVASKNWQSLSPSRQKEILRNFASLKSEAAQARNCDQAIKALSGVSVQFMGRAWQDGS